MSKTKTRAEIRAVKRKRKNIAIVILVITAAICVGTCLFFTQKNHQEIQIRFEKADGTYGEYQTVYSGNPRWGKKISYSWPGNQIYESCSLSYKSKGSQIHRYDIKRRKCTISVSADDATFDFSNTEASRTQVKNASLSFRIGEKYTISRITPRTGYHYVGMSSSSKIALSGKASKNMNIRLECEKDAVKNAVSFVSENSTATTGTFYAQPGKSYKLSELIEVPEGYILGDKYKINDGKEKSIDDEFTQGDAPMTFTVNCKKTEYTVTYMGIDSNTENPNPGKFSEPFTLQEPKKEGYTFKGWYMNGQQVTAVTKLENTVLTAEWEKDETDENTAESSNENDSNENNTESNTDTSESQSNDTQSSDEQISDSNNTSDNQETAGTDQNTDQNTDQSQNTESTSENTAN